MTPTTATACAIQDGRNQQDRSTWVHSRVMPLLLAQSRTHLHYTPAGQPIETITGSSVTALHQDQQGSTRS